MLNLLLQSVIIYLRLVDILTKHSIPTLRSNASTSSSPSTQQLVAPLVSMSGMLQEVSNMLDSVLSYVHQVIEGSIQGDAKIGQYLLDTLASVPVATASTSSFEEDFKSHLAVSIPPIHAY